ncbi:MAG: succinyl-diaminopimelate desuccinylase [Caulobacteraceae bacterium]|nr:succinyl-diaminopimelate desuccinylase [Caulobacteraceae bacterium]
MTLDVLDLARDLIRRPSVTPADAGAMDTLQRALEGLGFACRRMRFGEIENLYARRGTAGPNLCFAGHTDVVPAGDEAAWTSGPFEAAVDQGRLIGRGAVDMKGAIAAFVAAVSRLDPAAQKGSISLLITGDEEGVAKDGTGKVVAALIAEGETVDHCVLGEPTSAARFGDQIKVGRRGSLNARITVEGRQGHVAYPHKAANPIPVLVRLLTRLQDRVLDEGYPRFPASNLEITTIDVGNSVHNLIPARATATLNIRFNPHHDIESLTAWLAGECEAVVLDGGFSGQVSLDPIPTGNAFFTEPGAFVDLVSGAVAEVTGAAPELSTTGGISDARFIRALCPVIEFGLVGATMHAVDEQVPVDELRALEAVYGRLIDRYFAAFG